MQSLILRAHTISKHFMHANTKVQVLKNITLDFKNTTTYALTGLSGSGKSTLINILAGIDQASSGTVFFNTTDIATLSLVDKESFLNQSIGLMFQKPYLIAQLSPIENIMLPGLVIGKKYNECVKRAQELLDYIQISQKTAVTVGSLSGGQQQRIALARAIFNKPTFLIADEPTGSLDKQTGESIVKLLGKCHNDWNMGIIISTHDNYVAQHMHTVYCLENGSVI